MRYFVSLDDKAIMVSEVGEGFVEVYDIMDLIDCYKKNKKETKEYDVPETDDEIVNLYYEMKSDGYKLKNKPANKNERLFYQLYKKTRYIEKNRRETKSE